MKNKLFAIMASALLLAGFSHAQNKPWLMTYIADWNWGNPLTYSEVEWKAYDVFIDFGAAPGHAGSVNFPAGVLDTSGATTLAQRDSIVARAHSQGKKILLSVTEYPATYWDQCTTSLLISGYCQSIAQYVKRAWAPYDGIDVDWEYPSASDTAQFKNFLDSIRVYLPSPAYIVTVSCGQWVPFSVYAEKQNDIDMLTEEMYGGDGVSSGWPTWFNGPVYGINMIGKPELSCDVVVDSLYANGMPLSKIAISSEFGGTLIKGGTTTDSMGITINSNGITAPGEMWTTQPTGKADIPDYAYGIGNTTGIYQLYYNTAHFPNVKYVWNSTYQGSFLSNDSAGTTHDWELSFDDSNDITAKFNYVESKGLGGYFFYELGMDLNKTTNTITFQTLIDADRVNIFHYAPNSKTPIPALATLKQNYPNPFNPKTTINYQLMASNFVTLRVYDTLGRRVATLVHSYQNAGTHSVQFDGKELPSGVYIYRLQVGSSEVAKKMVLLK